MLTGSIFMVSFNSIACSGSLLSINLAMKKSSTVKLTVGRVTNFSVAPVDVKSTVAVPPCKSKVDGMCLLPSCNTMAAILISPQLSNLHCH